MYIKLIQPKMRKRPVDTGLKLHMAPPLGLLTIVSLLGKNNRISLENENNVANDKWNLYKSTLHEIDERLFWEERQMEIFDYIEMVDA